MKINGKCLMGDPVLVDRYTADWHSIVLHPSVFYRRIDQFEEGFKKVRNLYSEIDNGDRVYIRFQSKDDLTEFYRIHHEYI
jgi:hypothetical protein